MTYCLPECRRRSIRLRQYDYAQEGAYFVTICTRDRMRFFENRIIRTIAERCWLEVPDHHPVIQLDEWVIMPNHLHAIVVIEQCRGVQLNAPTTRKRNSTLSSISPHRNTLGTAVRTFKAAVTTLCRRAGHDRFGWQRNYYEHVVRNEGDSNEIRQYVLSNPAQWDLDEENPDRQQGARHAVPLPGRSEHPLRPGLEQMLQATLNPEFWDRLHAVPLA